jgi:hypothetical protein
MKLNGRSLFLEGEYDAVLLAIFGFLLIRALCAYGGIGVSPDSVVYISTAQNIRDHAVIRDFTNMPVMDFPVLYPIFLAGVLKLTRAQVLEFGPVLDGLLFATVIILSGYIMRRFTRVNRLYRVLLLVFITLSPCLLEIYSMIWSETLYLLLTVIFVIAAHNYFKKHTIRALLGMAIVAALACVTRYAGVSLVALGGLLLLCDWRYHLAPADQGGRDDSGRGTKPIVRWLGHMALYGVVAVSLFALNLYRNLRLTQTLTGFREPGLTPFKTNLHDFGSVLCDWLPFFNEHYGAASVVAVLFILLITGIFFWRLVRRGDFFSFNNIALSYFVVYAGFILYTATVSRFQQLDSRLLSPLFLPWLWGSTQWIPAAIDRCRGRWKTVAIFVSFAAAGCFIYGEWHDFKENWDGIHFAGIPGYTENSWKQSETLAYVRANKDSLVKAGPIYSDAFEGLWFLANVTSDLIPHRDNPEDIRYMMKQDHFTVVWFDDAVNWDLINMDEMRAHKELVKELHFKDGSIYWFKQADTLK